MRRVSRTAAFASALLVTVSLVAMFAAGCTPRAEGPPPADKDPIELPAAEVREYNGKRLDSVNDFRENSIKGPQKVDKNAYRLKVTGEVDTPLTLTYNQVIDRQTYKKIVRLSCVEGWSVNILWKGVKLTDILEQAGYDPSAKTVIFTCEDGYSTSLPLKYVTDRDLLLAYQMNGIDLPTERGFPFQVVAEDKWGYKWAKWVTGIEVSDNADYRGYWEKRGYDNEADLPGDKP